ncbi:DUF3606 domain-containing protein [Chryseobacterium sp. OSA05B]|uniref:DUF3606 domain-containing protein n=1 Tax=Chryseobacterium sp. OSA05B TaxID=2862650 RepID=UPI001CBF92BD|nr:DUF3606 domain-containing protein [Chryseobacterium sp. OSA05B]
MSGESIILYLWFKCQTDSRLGLVYLFLLKGYIWELEYWSIKFWVIKDQLKKAVIAVGTSTSAVKKHLGK